MTKASYQALLSSPSDATYSAGPSDHIQGRFFVSMENVILSNWKGSANTAESVKKQIVARWGEAEADSYDPKSNCLTFSQWQSYGYMVKKGEKALKSITIIEKKNEKGEVVEKYPKTVNLFYVLQVEKVG